MKSLLLSFVVLFSTLVSAQTATRWQDYFSYRQVSDIQQVGEQLVCASENALFSYDLKSKEIQKISKANLLKNVGVVAFAYSKEKDLMIVAFENGDLNLIKEGNISEIIDIPLDDYTGSKKINHLMLSSEYLIISADYGVSFFSLEKEEFSETIFFPVPALETALFNQSLYTATKQGIYTHEVNNTMVNFNDWKQSHSSPSQHITTFGNQLLASSGNQLLIWNGTNWNPQKNYPYSIVDLSVHENTLTVSSSNGKNANYINAFNESLTLLNETNINDDMTAQCAIYIQDNFYIGTKEEGMYVVASQEKVYPEGPYSNNAFRVTAINGDIWLAPGGMSNYNRPIGNTDGYSYRYKNTWSHVSSEELNDAKDIVHIAVNPQNTNEYAVFSWHQSTTFFQVNQSEKSILTEEFPSSKVEGLGRFAGGTYDKNGNLWATQSFSGNDKKGTQLLKIKGNNIIDRIDFDKGTGGGGVLPPVLDNQFIWVGGTRGDGLYLVDTQNKGKFYTLTANDNQGNLPSNDVHAVAIESNGTLWVGTSEGLHIKSNASNEVMRGNYETRPIVITKDGIPEAFLFETDITDIKIDNARQKWIATAKSGVFVLSSKNEVIFHFTELNSPLPSNQVYGIGIDDSTGDVFFATEKGLMSYTSDVASTNQDLKNILAYPNPVRPNYTGNVTIKGLPLRSQVQIIDVTGNLIYKAEASGGRIVWDTTNAKGQKVASGVYLVLAINEDGTEKATTKIAIIR